ncbi:semialdehyde dehydrogenase [Phlyctochytrium arcticum]|nr:semialdehyde dehydrogenase [Phlyctochytrium arcticum]
MSGSAPIPTAGRIPVGILGATGTVGQRFIQLLDGHPYFVVKAVGASPRSAGKSYKDAAVRSWKQSTVIPPAVASLTVQLCEPANFAGCRLVFSGLDSDVAGDVETAFLKADFAVFSNAKNYRMDPIVPLIVPLVNTSHFDIIPHQRKHHNLTKGFLITNANCSTTGLVVPLKALQDAFGPLSRVVVTTMQAISGAGYPGVPSLDILGNVVPYISGEEEKIEIECAKILGGVNADQSAFTEQPGLKVSASCNRVPVIDGHMESVMVEFANRPAPSIEQITAALASYTSDAQKLGAPSAPDHAIIVMSEPDRPQPRMDLMLGKGNSVSVGRVRPCSIFDVKFSLLSHNTILGAAGSSIMNAEVAVARGLLE